VTFLLAVIHQICCFTTTMCCTVVVISWHKYYKHYLYYCAVVLTGRIKGHARPSVRLSVSVTYRLITREPNHVEKTQLVLAFPRLGRAGEPIFNSKGRGHRRSKTSRNDPQRRTSRLDVDLGSRCREPAQATWATLSEAA